MEIKDKAGQNLIRKQMQLNNKFEEMICLLIELEIQEAKLDLMAKRAQEFLVHVIRENQNLDQDHGREKLKKLQVRNRIS